MASIFSSLRKFRAFRNRKSRAAIQVGDTAPRFSGRWYEALEERCLLSTVTFGMVGDFGDNSSAEADVAALVAGFDADFVVTAGDNRYGSLSYQQAVGNHFGEFLPAASGGTSATNRFFPAPGNHDYDDGGGINEYLGYFDLPGAGTTSTNTSGTERYYDVVMGDVHIFAIDSNQNTGTNGSQQQWLRETMQASTSAWQIVLTHHAPYSSSSNHGSQGFMQWDYAEWGADVVFAGHDHIYERINRDGIKYFVNGLGGRSFYGIGSAVNGSQFRYNSNYGAMKVVATETEMTFEFFNRNGTLIDSDSISQVPPLPEVSIVATDANAAEPSNNGRFSVSRTGDTTEALTVNYNVSGTATNGSDYNNLNGTVTIAAGQASANITVNPSNDNLVEGDETVELTLAADPDYILGSADTATVTIADDDAQTVSIVATDADAGEPTESGVFTVTRVGNTTDALAVKYSIAGTADNGTDYNTLGGSVIIAAGETSATITVDPIDDELNEGNETVMLSLVDDPAYFIGAASNAIVTINDDDVQTVSIVATDADAGEPDNNGTFTVTRVGKTTNALTVNYAIAGTADNGSDYNALSGSVIIAAGETSAIITVDSIDDEISESNETVVVTLAENDAYIIGDSSDATVTIIDDDVPPIVGTVFVTNGLDSGEGSFREAVEIASRHPGVDKIDVRNNVNQIMLESEVEFTGTQHLTIDGNKTVILASDSFTGAGVFVSSGAADLKLLDLTINGDFQEGEAAVIGVFVPVPADADGQLLIDLENVNIINHGLHGLHVSDQVNESDASVMLILDDVLVTNNGIGAADYDGIRVDEGGVGHIVAQIENARIDANGGDGLELDERGAGNVSAVIEDSTFNQNGFFTADDPGDGVDIDEIDDGGVTVRLEDVKLNDNLDQGFDVDEAGNGDVNVFLEKVQTNNNLDEGLKIGEENEGSLSAFFEKVTANNNGDEGIDVSEENEGDFSVFFEKVTAKNNLDDGIELEESDSGSAVVTLEAINVDRNSDEGIQVGESGEGELVGFLKKIKSQRNEGNGAQFNKNDLGSMTIDIEDSNFSRNGEFGIAAEAEVPDVSKLFLEDVSVRRNELGELNLVDVSHASLGFSIAGTVLVTNGLDSGEGSFRHAVEMASLNANVGTIVVNNSVNLITMASAVEFTGAQDLTIDGNRTVILAGDAFTGDGVFISSGAADLKLFDLTIDGDFEKGEFAATGIFVPVTADADGAADADGQILVDLENVNLINHGLHGLHIADQINDSGASILLVLDNVLVTNNGIGAIDQDGIRVDEGGVGNIVARIENARFNANGGEGLELDERGEGNVVVDVKDSTFNENGFFAEEDLDDGLDIDESEDGGVTVRLESVDVNGNFDEGLDFDEAGNGGISLLLEKVDANNNIDEGIKVSEENEGDLSVLFEKVKARRNGDDGIELKETEGGSVFFTFETINVDRNGDEGIQVGESGEGELIGHLEKIKSQRNAGNGAQFDEGDLGNLIIRIKDSTISQNSGFGIATEAQAPGVGKLFLEDVSLRRNELGEFELVEVDLLDN